MPFIYNDNETYDNAEAERHNEEIERRERNAETGDDTKHSRRGEKKGDKQKCINQTYLDTTTFDLLNNLASEQGLRVQTFLAIIARRFLDDPNSLSSSSFKLESLNIRIRRRIEYEETVRAAASEYAISKSPEVADLLVEMCDELGIDPEKAKTEAREDPMVEAIANLKSDPTSKRNQCAKWMIGYMKQHGYRVEAKTGNTAAKAKGFGKEIVIHARNTLGVVSAMNPEDSKFYWTYPESKRVAREILGGD